MASQGGSSGEAVTGFEFLDREYTVETSMIPFETHDVSDSTGTLVLELGALDADATATFSDTSGNPVFEVSPEFDDNEKDWVEAEEYTVTDVGTGEILARFEKTEKVGVRQWEIESADGTHIGRITSGSRLQGILRGLPLAQFFFSLIYSVQTPDGTQVGTITPSGIRMTGRSYDIEIESPGSLPTAALVAATLPLKFDESRRGGGTNSQDGTAAGE